MEPARKKSGSADPGTAKDTEHSWSTLTTITTFDLGNKSTFCLNTVDEDQTNRKIGQQGQQQITPATAICDKLYELQLINDTYNLREFEMLRGKYQRALYHLVSVARGTCLGAPMVKQLVQDDPIERPWTKKLLQDFSEDKDVITGLKNTIVNLKNDSRDKDTIIQELREEIALLQKKISEAKRVI